VWANYKRVPSQTIIGGLAERPPNSLSAFPERLLGFLRRQRLGDEVSVWTGWPAVERKDRSFLPKTRKANARLSLIIASLSERKRNQTKPTKFEQLLEEADDQLFEKIHSTHSTSYFHCNQQLHRCITADAACMIIDNCMNTKDTRVTVILLRGCCTKSHTTVTQ